MSFKDKINESMREKIAFTLAEGLKHDRYMRSHGKKAKNIVAAWAFTTKKDGWPEDNEMVMISNKKLSDAAKEAMKQLKSKEIYVMEDSEELEEKINKFIEGEAEFAYAAAQAKKAGKKEFKFAGKTWPVTIKTDIPEEAELDEDAKTLTANRPHRQGKAQYKQDNEKNQKQAIKDAEEKMFAEAADPDTVAMIKDNPNMKDKILRGLTAKARKEIEAALKESLEEGNLKTAAKELEAYARKNGGIDKNDFMKAVVLMKKGEQKKLAKFVDELDTEPREKILSVLDDHLTEEELDEGIFKAIGVAAKKAGKAVKSVATQKGRNDRKQAKVDRLRNKAKEISRAKALKKDVKQAKSDVRSARREDVNESSFETPSNEKKLADLGRKMMDMAKKEKNDMISNAMAKLGDLLTKYGTLYGPKNMRDLEKQSGMKQAIIIDLMKRANRK